MNVLGQFNRRTIGALLSLSLISGLAASAESLDLTMAVDRALDGNPQLALAGHRRQMQEGQILQSSLKPNLELDLEVENIFGSGLFQGVEGAETTLSLIWVLERGKRARRTAVANDRLSSIEGRNTLERLEVAADTTQAFLRVLRDQQRILQAAEAVRLAEEVVDAVRQRVRVGRSPSADLTRAEADLAWIALDQDDVSHELKVSRRVLAASWGATEADFGVATGDLFQLPEPTGYADLLARVGSSPLINQHLTEQRVRDAELLLAQAEAKPDWRVRAGAKYVSLVDESAFVAGVSIPLGLRNQNQGNIASASANAAMAVDERVATRVRIESTLFGLHQELLHNIHRADAMRLDVMPKMEAVLAEVQMAYLAGRYGYSELHQAQTALLQTRSAYLQESFQAHENRVGIERLTGTSITRPVSGESQ